MKKSFPVVFGFLFLVSAVLFFPALAQDPFPGSDAEGKKVTGLVMKWAGYGMLLTLGSAIFCTAVPVDFLKEWKGKAWGAFASLLILFFLMKMFPSVPKAVEEILSCPAAIFGLKCE